MNTKNLLLHALSFGVFVVSDLVSIFVISTITITGSDVSSQNLDFVYITLMIDYLTSFISQCVLCVILWELGTPEPQPEQEEEPELQ